MGRDDEAAMERQRHWGGGLLLCYWRFVGMRHCESFFSRAIARSALQKKHRTLTTQRMFVYAGNASMLMPRFNLVDLRLVVKSKNKTLRPA